MNTILQTPDELDVTVLRDTEPDVEELSPEDYAKCLRVIDDACRTGTLNAYKTVTDGFDAETLKWMRKLHTPDWVRRINRDYASGQLSYAEFLAGFELCATLDAWKGVTA